MFMVVNLQNIVKEHDLYLIYPNDFWHKTKIYNFDTIATNIPVLLMMLQGHIYE